jgi:hypothetical protein
MYLVRDFHHQLILVPLTLNNHAPHTPYPNVQILLVLKVYVILIIINVQVYRHVKDYHRQFVIKYY